MLVLIRKKNERIIFEGLGEITIVDVRGDKVRIGLQLPPEIRIMRAELLEPDDDQPAATAGIDVEQAAG